MSTATPTVIVTGASRGLGKAIALILADMGANLTLTARSADALQAVAAEVEARGASALVLPADVSQPVDCQQIVMTTVDHFGGLDGLVNNAGVIEPITRLAEIDLAGWDDLLRINVTAPLLLAQAALPHLRARHGRIVNISSGLAHKTMPAFGAYSTSKAALNMLTAVLGREEPDVTVVALRPGAVDTGMQGVIRAEGGPAGDAEEYQRLLRLHAEGNLLPPDQPGRAAAVLALHATPEMSGQFIQWQSDPVQALVDTYAPA